MEIFQALGPDGNGRHYLLRAGLFSPLLWQWSLKVMPDTLFLAAFWWCLERLTAVYVKKNEGAWWGACLARCAAPLTKHEASSPPPGFWFWDSGSQKRTFGKGPGGWR